MSDSVSRFSNRVANYVRYRPDYPRAVLTCLADEASLRPDSVVADIGCGTGISTRMFLENGNRVFGVEPNEAMREAAAEYLADLGDLTLVDGTSDDTTLPDASIDLIVAAQAFHWFDPERARVEFQRIAKAGGAVALIWNERRLDHDEYHSEYEKVLVKYSRDYAVVRHDRFDEAVLSEFFHGKVVKRSFENYQDLDLDGVKGRMLSASYMPAEGDDRYPELMDEIERLFAKHERSGRIKVFYDTNVYISHV